MQQIDAATLNGYSKGQTTVGWDRLLSFGRKTGGLMGSGLEGDRET